MCPKDVEGMANIADHDQTAPGGSALFAQTYMSQNFRLYGIFLVFLGDVRNDIYVTLCEGEFNRGSKTADKNVEVMMLVCNKKGEVIPVS